MKRHELIVIGAGPAGLSAAIEAKKNGMDRAEFFCADASGAAKRLAEEGAPNSCSNRSTSSSVPRSIMLRPVDLSLVSSF